MEITAQKIFTDTVRTLPPNEQLRLAALILQDLAQSEGSIVNYGNTWNKQDQGELTTYSLQYANQLYPEDEELV